MEVVGDSREGKSIVVVGGAWSRKACMVEAAWCLQTLDAVPTGTPNCTRSAGVVMGSLVGQALVMWEHAWLASALHRLKSGWVEVAQEARGAA